MNVSDLIVEVRDRDLVRVAQFTEADLAGLTFVLRANSVGSWEAILPATLLDQAGDRLLNPVAEALREEGAGLVIQTGAGTLLSGPMTAARFDGTADDPDGVWTITGVSDAVLLADALAFPQPSNSNPATQAVANDTRTATAEDLLRQYVSANIANGAIASPPTTWAPAGRLAGLRSKLRLQGPSLGRGPTLTFSPRFENLLELCQSIAAQGGLRFDVLQVGTVLEFVVTTPADRSALVQMDVENEQLAAVAFGVGSPATTVAVVAGQGEGAAREIVQVTSAESLAAETSWGRRIERFVDQRQAELTAELTQKGDEIVAAEGATVASVKASPSDDLVDVFMTEWRVGDFVSVVIRDVPIVVPVVEAAIRVSEQGLLVGATLGDPTGFDPEDLAFSRQSSTEARVSSLERNAEPPTWESLEGKPSTFAPAPHSHVGTDLVIQSLGTLNLDTVLAPGTYIQSTVFNGTLARNYPFASAAGLLEVHAASDHYSQRFTARAGATGDFSTVWVRSKFGTDAWNGWTELARPGERGIPFRMAAGTISVTGNGTPTATGTVTFPAGRFSLAPIVTGSASNSVLIVAVTARSATSATLTIRHADNSNFSNTHTITWQAVQMLATAAEG